jgi:hypothetical protein
MDKRNITYTNSKYTREEAIAEAQKHQDADDFIRGTYGNKKPDGSWSGCSVGCMGKEGRHHAYIEFFNIDQRIAFLSDKFFENLPEDQYKTMTLDLFQSIPEKVDSTLVYYRFMHWLLVDPNEGVILHAVNKSIVQNVADLYQRAIDGDFPSSKEWRYATAAADAATYAASAAAAYAAAAAANAAAYAVSAAAAYAAADAAAYAASAAYAYARQSHFIKMRDKLFQLFRDAPIVHLEHL